MPASSSAGRSSKNCEGFDQRFFVYFEEVDLSYRALQSGWVSFYLADVEAFHKGGGSSDQVKAVRLFYSMRSRILYVSKHFSVSAAVGLTLGTMIIEPVVRLASLAGRGSVQGVRDTLKGYAMLWWAAPGLLTGRDGRLR